ncbi:MAG: hypothetical protein ISQ80_02910 [Candidatus Actinomarina sp.]|jgi:hypothetical protein|nr:hypothetical protein [Candidatus Actinomarina sp.]MBL6836982.1 hypothetical protein [Candidatus Actinomarina sp.]
MSSSLLETLLLSSKIEPSEDYDATYETLPVVIAESTKDLDAAFAKLDEAGGYGYIATWRKNLFAFNTKLLSKRCGLIDENASLLKAARVPKN